MKFEISSEGKFSIITISGNIDSTESTGELDNVLSKNIAEGFHHFVFNIEKTTYLDSAGISIFIHCLCDVQENNGSVFIIAGDNQVKRVLDMVGINRLIKTYDSLSEFWNEQKTETY